MRLVSSLGGGSLSAAPEAAPAAVHLQDVDVVGEAFRPEDLGPLVEGEVGGDQDGAPLAALAEDIEEQFRPGGGQGDETQLVDDEQAQAGKLPLQVEQPSFIPGLHQLVDQGGGGESHRHSPLAGGQAQSQGDVGLAGAAGADGDDVLPPLDAFAADQFHHQGLVHLEGMAIKSKASRVLTAGKRAPRLASRCSNSLLLRPVHPPMVLSGSCRISSVASLLARTGQRCWKR